MDIYHILLVFLLFLSVIYISFGLPKKSEILALEDQVKEAQNLSITDYLTGIYNRRYSEQRLNEEIARAKRYFHPLVCLYLDLNNFKKINDFLGHKTGDEVLKLVADKLRKNSRETDIYARVGGDEFLLILPETVEGETEKIIFRLKEDIENINTELLLPEDFDFGVSIGVSFYEEGQSSAEVIKIADEAMYIEKINRRNSNKSVFY